MFETNLFAASTPSMSFWMIGVGRHGCKSGEYDGIVDGGHVVAHGQYGTALERSGRSGRSSGGRGQGFPTLLQDGVKGLQSFNVDVTGGQIGTTQSRDGGQGEGTHQRSREGLVAGGTEFFAGVGPWGGGEDCSVVRVVLFWIVVGGEWTAVVSDVGVGGKEGD